MLTFHRYGFSAPRKVQTLVSIQTHSQVTLLTKLIQVKQAIDKFILLYNPEFIRNHGPWEHVDDMLADLDMIDLVKEDALSYFTNSLFANEVVEAATRVNYGQNLDTIHALGALVSMAGSNGMVR